MKLAGQSALRISEDLSKKIKSAKHEKMRRGEAVSKNAPFGYKLNEARQMVIDEPAADVVRLFFRLTAERCGLVEIERQLYSKKHPTPKCRSGERFIADVVTTRWFSAQPRTRASIAATHGRSTTPSATG